jgi:hypothetical protein
MCVKALAVLAPGVTRVHATEATRARRVSRLAIPVVSVTALAASSRERGALFAQASSIARQRSAW